jgi:hypothetical protein
MKIGMGMLLVAACGAVEPAVESEPAWTVDHATTDGVLLGVWGSRPDDIWVVGGQADRSVVMHGDGQRWSAVDVLASSLLYSIYGFSDSDIYAVGERGTILHFDGAEWTRVASGTELPLYGLWGSSGDDVWIVGGDRSAAPIVLHGVRGSFSRVELPAGMAPKSLFKPHGFAPDDVMLVGSESTVLRWNGTTWRRETVPTTGPLLSTWGRSATDVYAVGGSASSEIVHFDGRAWSQVAELPTGWGLTGVFTSADGTFAVGPQSLMFELRRDGSAVQVTLPKLDPATYLHGVWGDGHGTTYAVGGELFAYPRPMGGVILSRR